MTEFSLVAQIAEVEREIVMRNKVYPQWVARAKMKQGEADYHLGRMEAVLVTLKWLQRNEAKIKQKVEDTSGDKL
jgi:hypothetical protein